MAQSSTGEGSLASLGSSWCSFWGRLVLVVDSQRYLLELLEKVGCWFLKVTKNNCRIIVELDFWWFVRLEPIHCRIQGQPTACYVSDQKEDNAAISSSWTSFEIDILMQHRFFCHQESPDISWLFPKTWHFFGKGPEFSRMSYNLLPAYNSGHWQMRRWFWKLCYFVFVRCQKAIKYVSGDGWGFGFPSYLLSLLFESGWGERQILLSSALPTVTVEVRHRLVHIIGSKQRHNMSRASSWKDLISVGPCPRQLNTYYIMQYNPSNLVVYSIISIHIYTIQIIYMTNVLHASILIFHSMLDWLYMYTDLKCVSKHPKTFPLGRGASSLWLANTQCISASGGPLECRWQSHPRAFGTSCQILRYLGECSFQGGWVSSK